MNVAVSTRAMADEISQGMSESRSPASLLHGKALTCPPESDLLGEPAPCGGVVPGPALGLRAWKLSPLFRR